MNDRETHERIMENLRCADRNLRWATIMLVAQIPIWVIVVVLLIIRSHH